MKLTVYDVILQERMLILEFVHVWENCTIVQIKFVYHNLVTQVYSIIIILIKCLGVVNTIMVHHSVGHIVDLITLLTTVDITLKNNKMSLKSELIIKWQNDWVNKHVIKWIKLMVRLLSQLGAPSNSCSCLIIVWACFIFS